MDSFNDELSSNSIAEDIYDTLQDYKGSSIEQMFDDLYNHKDNPPIIGTYNCSKACAQFHAEDDGIVDNSDYDALDGAFGAINFVRAWNDEQGIEPSINELTDPEQVAAEVEYIRAEAIIEDIDEQGIDDEDKLTDSKIAKLRRKLDLDYNLKAVTEN